MPIARFRHAFAYWTAADPARFDRFWSAPLPTRRGVRLRLRRFAPYLVAWLSEDGVDVELRWRAEAWDLLFSVDLAAERVRGGGWRCRLCPEPRREHAEIEALWADHLFQPLADWVEQTLTPADALYLCGTEGATWGLLADKGTPPPDAARFAAYADT